MLKERDFERAEFTRAAQKFEQTESKLTEFTKLLEEKDTEIRRLEESIVSLQDRKTSLLTQCELDRTKIEDLEFKIEEYKLGCVNATTGEGSPRTGSPKPSNESMSQQADTSSSMPKDDGFSHFYQHSRLISNFKLLLTFRYDSTLIKTTRDSERD